MPTPFHRSLRSRALVAILLVVLAPVAFVWLSDGMDARAHQRMMENVEAVVLAAAQAGPDEQVAAASEGRVWLRVVSPDDRITLEVDAEAPSTLLERAGLFFFGPDGAPTLREWDSQQPDLVARPEVEAARQGLTAVTCEQTEAGNLLVCWAAAPVAGGDVVHVQESSRRAIRALYDVRYQVLKLSLFVGLTGLALAGWLGGRIVGPIAQLRDELRARMASEGPVEAMAWERRDELGELARDIDLLMASLEDRNRALGDANAALAEHSANLDAANAALAEKNRETEAFVAALAHEFKNPVAAIRAAAEGMERGRARDDLRTARLARVLRDSSGRLDALLSQLLELVRAEAGLPTEAREPVALDALMAGLVEGARARHELMTLSLDAAPLTVRAVPARLETALRNVLDNATAFAGPEDPEAWVGVTVYEDEGAAVIRVSDSGPGIAEADLPRIFERFFTTRVGSGGTGLGLALTATVVEAHGGSVEAASPPGGGAVITLRLPLAPARAGEEPP